jgi:hypothetical protein
MWIRISLCLEAWVHLERNEVVKKAHAIVRKVVLAVSFDFNFRAQAFAF